MTRFTKYGAALAATALVGTALLSACGTNSTTSGSSSSKAPTELDLAFLGALTGDSGNLGQAALIGIQTAVNEYNAGKPKTKVEIKSYDSQGDATQAVPLAQTIISDSTIVGLVGPAFSGESKSTGAAFFQAGLPSISESATNVDLTKNGWTTWHRDIANDGAQGPAAAKYLTDTVKATKVFVIDDSEDYGKGLADAVRSALGSVDIGNDAVNKGQTDFSGTVTKVQASGADAVYYGGYYADAGLLLKQLRQAGWKGTFGSGDGSHDPGFIAAAGADAAEGAFLTDAGAPTPDSFTAKVAKYDDGKTPGAYTAEAYDATKVFLDGIKAGNYTRADLQKFIGTYDKQGVTKEIKFDATGEVATQTIYAYPVKGGVFGAGTAIK